jgi:hypothetical protein
MTHTVHGVSGDLAKRGEASSSDSIVLGVIDCIDEDLIGQHEAALVGVAAHIRERVDVCAQVLPVTVRTPPVGQQPVDAASPVEY